MNATPRPQRRFGQNFLINQGVLDKLIAALDPQPTDTIIEIGPGPGALTGRLAASDAQVIAVELDRRMIATLEEQFRNTGNVTLLHHDIVTFDPPPLPAGMRYQLIGNIPYNISAPILLWLCAHRDQIATAIVTVQREVAHRLTATPNTKAWGPLSIAVQSTATAQRLFDIQPHSFRPAPKVVSTAVRLAFPIPPPYAIPDPAALRDLVRTLFTKRRKMLRHSLAANRLLAAGIDPTRRVETLTIEELLRLVIV
ncbi:MAG: ribosomal RNA small subunit methyltransferase A [Deltaproteobacteria bacterium]|nr:ribosomal RNA small subunit methyltransferase A [Deltaproteobacteria bacterium]